MLVSRQWGVVVLCYRVLVIGEAASLASTVV